MSSIACPLVAALLAVACAASSLPVHPQDSLPFSASSPAMEWRGMHVTANGHASMDALVRLLTTHMPRLRLNALIVEVNYNYRYSSHPEVAEEGGLTREDCRRLADLARQNHIRLIPMINCLGHQSWAATTGKLVRVHPEFDETPDLPPNNPGIYCRSWCPSNPDVNRLVFDLIDELTDAFRADAVHVGMDEVFILGECAKCRGKGNAALFAKAVNDLHDHIVKKRRLQMMMWGDRLLDGKAMKLGKWEASENDTYPAVDMVPKDIVLCDWHYNKVADFPSVKFLLDKGFRVWPSGWNSGDNARLLAECALRNRQKRMVGYLATTWVSVDSLVAALDGDEKALARDKNLPGVVEAIRVGALTAWNGRPPSP